MKKLTAIFVASVFSLTAGAASAVTINAADEANGLNGGGGERAELDNYVWNNANTGGLAVTLTGFTSSGSTEGVPYFDSATGGLGVCGVPYPAGGGGITQADLDALGGGTGDCGSDDSLQSGESVTMSFGGSVTITNLMFNDHGNSLSGKNVRISADGYAGADYSFDTVGGETFANVSWITFSYATNNGNRFYFESASVNPIPLPAGAVLMLTGLGGLAIARRRRK